jgi:hypothetical protein
MLDDFDRGHHGLAVEVAFHGDIGCPVDTQPGVMKELWLGGGHSRLSPCFRTKFTTTWKVLVRFGTAPS